MIASIFVADTVTKHTKAFCDHSNNVVCLISRQSAHKIPVVLQPSSSAQDALHVACKSQLARKQGGSVLKLTNHTPPLIKIGSSGFWCTSCLAKLFYGCLLSTMLTTAEPHFNISAVIKHALAWLTFYSILGMDKYFSFVVPKFFLCFSVSRTLLG